MSEQPSAAAKSSKASPGKAKGTWDKRRSSSFRLSPNRLERAGALATLKVEGLAKPKELVGQPVEVRLVELDQAIELATFEATLAPSGKGFVFASARRTDDHPRELPAPEKLKAKNGDAFRFETHWWRPHFLLQFEGCAEQHVIVVPVGDQRPEGMVYELGFEVKAGGKLRAKSSGHASLLTCGDVLAHNCRQAARLFVEGHYDMIVQRGIGTHCGTSSEYFKLRPSLGTHARIMAYVTRITERLEQARQAVQANPPSGPRMQIPAGRARGLTEEEIEKVHADLKREVMETVPAGEDNPYGVEETDCVTFVYELLIRAYGESLAEKDWDIAKRTFFADENRHGVSLVRGLAEAGWEIVYYNPDTRNPDDYAYMVSNYVCTKCKTEYNFDLRHHQPVFEELGDDWRCSGAFQGPKDKMPVLGGCKAPKSALERRERWMEHTNTAQEALSQGTYYGIKLKHLLVDYEPTFVHKCEPKRCRTYGARRFENGDAVEARRCDPAVHARDGGCMRELLSGEFTPRASKDLLARVLKAPFAVLLGRSNGHVATLIEGKVWEARFENAPDDPGMFRLEYQFEGKRHRGDVWDYISGVLAFPPGTLDARLPPVAASPRPRKTSVYGRLNARSGVEVPASMLAGVPVRAWQGDDFFKATILTTDERGHFFASLEPGEWTFHAEIPSGQIPTVKHLYWDEYFHEKDGTYQLLRRGDPDDPIPNVAVRLIRAVKGSESLEYAASPRGDQVHQEVLLETHSADGSFVLPATKGKGRHTLEITYEDKAIRNQESEAVRLDGRPVMLDIDYGRPSVKLKRLPDKGSS